MSRARSTMRTGSPMSSTRISPPLALQPRLQQELRRLRQRHEVARDVGVRDRHRAAARDLLAEARDHAAGAAEHVAEAHEHELRAAVLQALAHDLRQPLGRAHHVGRVDRLVGRHEHELLDLGGHRRARQHPACRRRCCARPATRWSPPSAARACTPPAWNTTSGFSRASTSSTSVACLTSPTTGDERQLRERVGERRLDLVDARPRRCRTARARAGRKRAIWRHSSAPIEPPAPVTITTRLPSHSREPRAVEHHGIAAEQVVELDVAQRRQRRAAADQVLVRRHRQRLDARRRRRAPRRAGARAWFADGSAMITLRTPYASDPHAELGDRSQHADVAQQRGPAWRDRRRAGRRRATGGCARAPRSGARPPRPRRR